MLSRKKDFIKIDDFNVYPVLAVHGLDLLELIRTDYLGFDFHKISLSGIAEAS